VQDEVQDQGFLVMSTRPRAKGTACKLRLPEMMDH
jgi:hypothetical protein